MNALFKNPLDRSRTWSWKIDPSGNLAFMKIVRCDS